MVGRCAQGNIRGNSGSANIILYRARCIACLAVSGILVSAGSATTEDQVTSPAKQMALAKKQIEGVLTAQKEMDEINEKLSEKARPHLIVAEQLESVAKKNGFASYDEYTDVVDNISIVLAGFDPVTKTNIGSEVVIRAQIARVQADKNMPAENKTEALAELNNALKSPAPPVENRGNIDLVATYYDKLADTMGSASSRLTTRHIVSDHSSNVCRAHNLKVTGSSYDSELARR
jgi:hypothetical protein